jgi:hypothetical protein
MGTRLEELFGKIHRFDREVANIGEPWHGGLSAILSQLQLAIESFASLREVTAEGILTQADELVSQQLNVFRREVLPHCPPGVSEAAVFDRKADLIRLLDISPTERECIASVIRIAQDALRDRDQLTLYCLATGPLDFYYRARRLDRDIVREKLLELSGRGHEAEVLQRLVGPNGVSALLGDFREAMRDPSLVVEVEQAMLKPKLDLEELARAGAAGEDSDDLREMEEEYRRVAAMANKLSGQPR